MEIDAITEKEKKKLRQAEQEKARKAVPLASKVHALTMSRLGIPNEIISDLLKINPRTAKQYGQEEQLLDPVRKSLCAGLSVSKTARKHNWPEPLVWSVAFEGKEDIERFREIGWGIRTWDLWTFGNCDQRLGDDWPARIPARIVGPTLYFFSGQGDLVMDPMAGGGVVADTCLAFSRRCRSFDMAERPDTRPEIEPFFWDMNNLQWPIKGNDKPDLVIFDPPYFSKKAGDYDAGGISGLSRQAYLDFLRRFFKLALRHTPGRSKPGPMPIHEGLGVNP